MRVVALWCPDWPLVAAGVDPDRPAIVREAERVVACSVAARAAGVRPGQRRREAQTRCPDLLLLEADVDRDAAAFAPVVTALHDHLAVFEVVRPGLTVADVRGPARTGQRRLAERLVATARAAGPASTSAHVGVADGRFAAVLAARAAFTVGEPARLVPPDRTPGFVAAQPLEALRHGMDDVDELLDLLARLGVSTLGDLAGLPSRQVFDRFGHRGLRAHRLAGGDGSDGIDPVVLPEPVRVRAEIDPPAERVDVAAFAARAPAERLVGLLHRRTALCRLLAVGLHTEHGEQLVRRWRSTDGFGAAAIVDRVRWQLDGWLASPERPTAGVSLLELVVEEAVHGGDQLALTDGTADHRVTHTLARLQGLLGAEQVRVGRPSSGREPAEWVRSVPWQPDGSAAETDPPPWPGRLPPPAPATVLVRPRRVELVDADGRPVGVSARGELSAPPQRVRTDRWRPVDGWGGPWPADERWWEPAGRRRARLQVVTADGDGLLLSIREGVWYLDARYD